MTVTNLWKLELSTSLLYLVEQNADVVLISREPIHREGHYHVDGRLSEQCPQLFDTKPVQVETTGSVPDGLSKRPAIGINVLLGCTLLGIQRTPDQRQLLLPVVLLCDGWSQVYGGGCSPPLPETGEDKPDARSRDSHILCRPRV